MSNKLFIAFITVYVSFVSGGVIGTLYGVVFEAAISDNIFVCVPPQHRTSYESTTSLKIYTAILPAGHLYILLSKVKICPLATSFRIIQLNGLIITALYGGMS